MANFEMAGHDAVRPPRRKRNRRNRHRDDDSRQQHAAPERAEDDVAEQGFDDDPETENADVGEIEGEDDDRVTRAQETREADDFDDEDDDWEPPELLDAPPARPGYVQRWIRTTAKGVSDPQNVAKRFNQRWRPRSPDTVPKGQYVPTIQHGEHAGCIGIEGMVLMERPAKIQAKQRKRNADMTRMQMEGVESDLHKIHDPSSGLGQPSLKSKSTVVRGRPKLADDD